MIQRRRDRLARIVELRSLLKASREVFLWQNALAERLTKDLEKRFPNEIEKFKGLEDKISGLFEKMNSQELELHSLIRSITEHGVKPLNEAMLNWVQNDSTYKLFRVKKGRWNDITKDYEMYWLNALNQRVLAGLLYELETHLLIWQAKYQIWIISQPKHALVYLADEEAHGPRFPSGFDKFVEKLLG